MGGDDRGWLREESPATQEIVRLKSQLATRERRIGELGLELTKDKGIAIALEENNRELTLRVLKLQTLAFDDDCWHWAGDGSDYLESMGNEMVVRITGGDLRAAIAKAESPS